MLINRLSELTHHRPYLRSFHSSNSLQNISEAETKRLSEDLDEKDQLRIKKIINLINQGGSKGERIAAEDALRRFFANRGTTIIFIEKKFYKDKNFSKRKYYRKESETSSRSNTNSFPPPFFMLAVIALWAGVFSGLSGKKKCSET